MEKENKKQNQLRRQLKLAATRKAEEVIENALLSGKKALSKAIASDKYDELRDAIAEEYLKTLDFQASPSSELASKLANFVGRQVNRASLATRFSKSIFSGIVDWTNSLSVEMLEDEDLRISVFALKTVIQNQLPTKQANEYEEAKKKYAIHSEERVKALRDAFFNSGLTNKNTLDIWFPPNKTEDKPETKSSLKKNKKAA